MRIGISVRPDENLLGKFRIEDGAILTFEYMLRIAGLIIVPFFLILFFLGYFMESGADLSQRLFFGTMMALTLITFLSLLILLPVILYYWFHYWRKGFVTLTDRSLSIYLPALKEEWVKNRVMLENIKSARMLTDGEVKVVKSNTIWHRIKLLPRPKHLVNGFYHQASRPKGLIRIELYQQTPVYNFYKHSLETRQAGPIKVPRLVREDSTLICDASDRYIGYYYSNGVRRQRNGPAIRGYIVNRFYIKLRRRGREKFLTMLNELIRNNKAPAVDITMELLISELQMKGWTAV